MRKTGLRRRIVEVEEYAGVYVVSVIVERVERFKGAERTDWGWVRCGVGVLGEHRWLERQGRR